MLIMWTALLSQVAGHNYRVVLSVFEERNIIQGTGCAARIPFCVSLQEDAPMKHMGPLISVTLKWTLRDRALHGLFGATLLLFALIPIMSIFSMRQVQELSITLSLSMISFILLILAVLLGSSSVWRDIERRYTASVLGLPISRATYISAKFIGIAFFIISCAALLGLAACLTIGITRVLYPPLPPVNWLNICIAVIVDSFKYILLGAFSLLFSALSTSFFLPFFGTIAVFLAGNASQEVFEFISGDFGKTMARPILLFLKMLYYLLPNFSAFNLKVQAIYGLPLSGPGLAYTILYFVIYTSLLVIGAQWIFSRRELS